MTAPRRKVIRNEALNSEIECRKQKALQRSEARLKKERIARDRWIAKLKRALRAVDKHQSQVARLEKTVSLLRQM